MFLPGVFGWGCLGDCLGLFGIVWDQVAQRFFFAKHMKLTYFSVSYLNQATSFEWFMLLQCP